MVASRVSRYLKAYVKARVGFEASHGTSKGEKKQYDWIKFYEGPSRYDRIQE